jgi:hypothetical protein
MAYETRVTFRYFRLVFNRLIRRLWSRVRLSDAGEETGAPAMAAPDFSIDPHTGNMLIGHDVRLTPKQDKASVEPLVARFFARSWDHGNGYEWLFLQDLSFGGRPTGLALCFHDGLLGEASWNVDLPDANADSWPTREEIDEEIAFVRKTLKDMGLATGHTRWGEVWSAFDPKGDLAANGIRYLVSR